MKTTNKIIVFTVISVGAFALGRYSVPEKVRVETKVVEVEKKEIKKDKKSETVIVKVTKPDGTVEEHTTIVSGETTDINKNVNTVSNQNSEIVRGDIKLSVSALVGTDLSTNNPVYGASLTTPVLGPILLGAFGLTNKTFGLSVGLTF